MKYILACIMVMCLSAPAYAQTAEADIEAVTGRDFEPAALQVYVAGGDSAFVASDSLWWVKGARDWVRCPTEPAPFAVDSLTAAARATLRGQASPGMNGPLSRMQKCVWHFSSTLDSLQ